MVGMRPVSSTPAILATSLPNYAPMHGVTKLLYATDSEQVYSTAYEVSQWPVIVLPALHFIPETDTGDIKPVSASALMKIVAKDTVAPEELDAILSPILNATLPLSGSAHQELYRFISICTSWMEGGLPVAVDWGILLWIIPALSAQSEMCEKVKALLDEYPLSQSKL